MSFDANWLYWLFFMNLNPTLFIPHCSGSRFCLCLPLPRLICLCIRPALPPLPHSPFSPTTLTPPPTLFPLLHLPLPSALQPAGNVPESGRPPFPPRDEISRIEVHAHQSSCARPSANCACDPIGYQLFVLRISDRKLLTSSGELWAVRFFKVIFKHQRHEIRLDRFSSLKNIIFNLNVFKTSAHLNILISFFCSMGCTL